jgi:transposase
VWAAISGDDGRAFRAKLGSDFAGSWAGLFGKLRIDAPSGMKESKMPTGRLNMRRIRDLLRLKFGQGLSERDIAVSLGLSKGSVGAYIGRAQRAQLSWPLPEGLDDDSLELLLFPAPATVPDPDRPIPDWLVIDRELRRPGVTRMLLWEEYRAAHPEGFAYTWFCTHYEAWKGRVRPTMRQTHVGGEKVFVDFAGDTIDVIDPVTGEARAMKLFVAAMGASNYTYAEAVASEGLEDWILAHVRMFAFLGGVPKAVVPDNLKAAVIKADRFDPGLNRTYAEMAAHYGTAVLPARPRKPRDKAKVEVAVQVAQRWILARLRNHRFFSLAELNVAIRRLLDELNMRIMRGYGASRADLFATLDRPNLQPLPPESYVFARWKRARVAPDYHVEVDNSWYSEPPRVYRRAKLSENCPLWNIHTRRRALSQSYGFGGKAQASDMIMLRARRTAGKQSCRGRRIGLCGSCGRPRSRRW